MFKNFAWLLLLGAVALFSMGVDAGLMDKIKAGNDKLKDLAEKSAAKNSAPKTFGEKIVRMSQEDPKSIRDQ